jgi:dihydrofolate reductase
VKAQSGKDMVVCGAGLAASFMRLDLIDEYRPVVHPIVLGGGKPMFPALDKVIGLRLIETRLSIVGRQCTSDVQQRCTGGQVTEYLKCGRMEVS